MNDERLGKEIGAFYRETDVTPPDSQESARQVAARLGRTPQLRRRRWLPPWRLRTTRPPDVDEPTDQTAEHQLSSIPTTTDRFPTATGRTRLMLSPAKAITAGALVFAIGGVLLIAQPFSQQSSVPGAEQGAEPAAPVKVTITFPESGTEVDPGECTTHAGGLEACTSVRSRQWSATDPRLSGTATERVTEYFWEGPPGTILEAYAIEIVNDEGAWVGTGRGIGGMDITDQSMYTLTGEGEHEGLSAVLTPEFDPVDLIKALIIDGELPPLPEPIE